MRENESQVQSLSIIKIKDGYQYPEFCLITRLITCIIMITNIQNFVSSVKKPSYACFMLFYYDVCLDWTYPAMICTYFIYIEIYILNFLNLYTNIKREVYPSNPTGQINMLNLYHPSVDKYNPYASPSLGVTA